MDVQISQGTAEGLELLSTKWRDPSTPTKAAAADAVMKLVSAGVLPADSAVTLEQLGFDQTTIDRITADRRRAQAGDRLTQLVAAARQATGQAVTDGNSNADSGVPGAVPVASGSGAA
jgi:hypothetical protein